MQMNTVTTSTRAIIIQFIKNTFRRKPNLKPLFSMNFEFIDLQYLRSMSDGDDDMFATLVQMIIAELPQEIALMNQALLSEDWNTLFEISHKMKTTLSFIGNERMIIANKKIEDFSRKQLNLQHVPEMMGVLNSLTDDVVRELAFAIR